MSSTHRGLLSAASAAFILAAAPGMSRAALIDFETVPGGTPSEGLNISTQYQALFGVSFSLLDGAGVFVGNPVLAEVGSPRTAFQGPGNGDDTPAQVLTRASNGRAP